MSARGALASTILAAPRCRRRVIHRPRDRRVRPCAAAPDAKENDKLFHPVNSGNRDAA